MTRSRTSFQPTANDCLRRPTHAVSQHVRRAATMLSQSSTRLPPSSSRGTRSPRSPTRSARSCSRAARRAAGGLAFAICVRRWSIVLLYVDRLSARSSASASGAVNIPVGLGLCDRQFRVVDRHRARRHADLGDSALAASEMADVDQSLRRGDDALRRDLRRAVSAVAPGPAVVLLLAACPIRTRWISGRSFAARWSGTCSPSARISPCR